MMMAWFLDRRRLLRGDRGDPLVGASILCLPPYSSNLCPIEQAFVELKAPLPKAAARSLEGLWTAIGQLLDAFSPAKCATFSTCAFN